MKARIGAGLVCAFATGAAQAGPEDYIFLPAVSYGERELDFKYGAATKAGDPTEQAASLGFGYGAAAFWFTEFYLKYKLAGTQTRFDAVERENKFQLTETGKYPVDVGFIIEFEVPRDRSEGYEFRWGPLFQTEFDRLQLNANFILTNITRANEGNGTTIGYQWQAKYRWQRLAGRQAIVYNAALLFGVTRAAPDRTFRLQAEYEF